MKDWPIVGHRWAAELLAHHIENDQVSHAYLFTGPEGVGRTTLALAFAQALVCEAEERPCGVCRACRHVAAGLHPDVKLVEPEGGTLRVEQVREVTREASRRPLEAPYRVFILTHMERAHPAAANALLKTLEEPPPYVVIVLTAASEDVILPTLVSRCQVLALRPVPEADLVAALQERWGVSAQEAVLLARLSGGRPGWALRAREDTSFWALRDRVFDLVHTFAETPGRWVRLQEAERWAQEDEEHRLRLLHLLQGVYRDILVLQEGKEEAVRNVDRLDVLRTWADQLAVEDVAAFFRRLLDTQRYMQGNINARLALDVLFLHAPRPTG